MGCTPVSTDSTTVVRLGKQRARDYRARTRPVWMEKPSFAMQGLKGLVLLLVCVAVIYPFLVVIGTSLSTQQEIAANNGFVLIPMHPTLEAYRTILSGGIVTEALFRSIGITLVGTALSVALTVMMAYGLSRRIMGGNFFELKPQFSRQDASYGHVLLGDGKLGFEWQPYTKSGLFVRDEVRHINTFKDRGGKEYILIAVNNGQPRIFAYNRTIL